VVGTPLWPGYALRSIGLFLAVAAVLFLLGGLVQINPIWLWGPYEPDLSTNAAQPDWYLGWLLGGLRLMPPFEPHVLGYTIAPNPFFAGALFPLVVFAVLYAWPLIDRRRWSDGRAHNLLERPRDNPRRTAAFFAFLSAVAIVFAAGSIDRLYFEALISYEAMVWALRFAAIALPFVVYFVVRRICEELRGHPLRGWTGTVVRRGAAGGFEVEEREA